MQRTKKVSVFLMVGLLVVGIAVFTQELGLASNSSWYKGRIVVLIFGLFVALIPWVPWKRLEAREKIIQSDLFVFPALLIVIGIYIWFMSVSHNSTSNYYALLATSFQQGDLSLPLRPDAALLALPNPYDPAARQGVKAPLDLSLYKGKFYLYWGPAPALLLAVIEPLFPGKVSDAYLLTGFVCGIFLLLFLLIMHIWEQFFPEISKRILILSILIAGLISPSLWLLSQPKIYETAIAGGQFFFIAGLFSAFTALDRPAPSSWRLVLAGVFWSLAVGTRSVLIFPIAFMVLMIIYWLIRTYRQSFLKLIIGLLPLGLSLLAGAVAFGWYNWARFGSIAETGFSYALAGPYLQKHLNELFSPAYIFQNLYNYLLNPFTVKQSFPLLYPLRGMIQAVLPWQVLPEIYSAQAITGILCAAPFTVFAIIAIAVLLKQLFRKNQVDLFSESLKISPLRWITTSLIGSFVFSFLCLLMFFWAAMRYAEDFVPTLTLLSIIGFWQGHRSFSQKVKKGKMYALLGIVLASISIIISIFLALSVYIGSL
ncbi:MAG TPA: hypothetical protein VK206_13940 [Anaerolineales bacterium]|nr:hypothetical protein [Anaerolineales bacterium]